MSESDREAPVSLGAPAKSEALSQKTFWFEQASLGNAFQGALAGALDRLTEGVMLVDGAARLLFANETAKRLVRDRRGLRIAKNGALGAQRHGDTVALRRAISACVCANTPACDHFILVGCTEAPPLSVLVTVPLETFKVPSPLPSVAVLFIADPERFRRPTAEHLQHRFALTRTEARLALEVLAGDGLDACSQRLRISKSTARTHLRHIFEKTGTSRQAELVRILLSVGSAILTREERKATDQ